METSKLSILTVDAHTAGSYRGLQSDTLAADTLQMDAFLACSSIVAAGDGHVTDITEVPSDTVLAQIQHISEAHSVGAVKIGTLGSHKTVEVLFDWLENQVDLITLLDFSVSGPSGETVLTQRGVELLTERMRVADLVSVNRQDAELVTGGEITSLDDAQVAAQRLHQRGATNVLLRCGHVRTRFHDPLHDPGMNGEADSAFMSDLFYDGSEFALFEAPYVDETPIPGLSSYLHLAILCRMHLGHSLPEAVQFAKGFVTETARQILDNTQSHSQHL